MTIDYVIPSLKQQTIVRLQKIQIGLGPVSKPGKRCLKIQIGLGPVSLCILLYFAEDCKQKESHLHLITKGNEGKKNNLESTDQRK